MANIYAEEVPLTQWAAIMIGLFITILTPTILIEALGVLEAPWLLWLYIFMDLFFIIMLLNFRKMRITIDQETLMVSFGLIKKNIKLVDIQACEAINATLGVFTGMGIRYGGDGSLAYLPRLGAAIKLELTTGRPFVFSTNNREQVLEILNQYCKEPVNP